MAMSNNSRWAAWLAGLALAGGGAYWGYQKWYAAPADAAATAADAKGDMPGKGAKGKGKGRPVAPVAVTRARSGDVKIYLNGLGTVTPLRTVTVRSRVDGQLMRVNFTEGQEVRQGDLLAEIDPRPFQAQLLQVEGQMQRDQALLANARVDLQRYRGLLAQDSIAEQQVANQEALVRQLEGTVKADQGLVDNARLQLSYARVTAPIPGQLGLRQVDQGNVVRAGDANGIVVITQTRPITVLFTIPQDNLPQVLKQLRAGESVPVEIFDREQKVKLDSGVLLTADNQIDVTTGTVRLKAQVPNSAGMLFPNQFVNVRMLVDTRKDAVTVPGSAIQRGAQGFFLYVVKEDRTLSLRQVKTGVTEGSRIVIESGVKGGERVVIDGMDRLRDGMRVEIADRAAKGDKGGGKGGRRPEGAQKGGAAPAPGDTPGAAVGDAASRDAVKADTADGAAAKGERPRRATPPADAANGGAPQADASGDAAKSDPAADAARAERRERRRKQREAEAAAAK